MSDDMMELDDVIEEEASGDEGFALGLVIFTTIFLLAAIFVCLYKLGTDYNAGLLASS